MTNIPVSLQFPANPSLEQLRKVAKEHLKEMRLARSDATLSDAQFQLARLYGFSSWRALRVEVDQRRQALGPRLSALMADIRPVRRQAARSRALDPAHVEHTFFALCGLMIGLPTMALNLALSLDLFEKIPLTRFASHLLR